MWHTLDKPMMQILVIVIVRNSENWHMYCTTQCQPLKWKCEQLLQVGLSSESGQMLCMGPLIIYKRVMRWRWWLRLGPLMYWPRCGAADDLPMLLHGPIGFWVAAANGFTWAHSICQEVLLIISHGLIAFSVAMAECFTWTHHIYQ